MAKPFSVGELASVVSNVCLPFYAMYAATRDRAVVSGNVRKRTGDDQPLFSRSSRDSATTKASSSSSPPLKSISSGGLQ
jgi:hypothetical protein